MLADDIASALPDLRVQAEALMQDACVIESPNAPGGWNDSTGTYEPQGWTVAYSGVCRVQVPNTEGSQPVVGGVEWQVGDVVVSIPLDYTLGDPTDMRVTVTSLGDLSDPDLLGAQFTVAAAVSVKSYATARRLHCRRVSS